jgi:phosphatidylserine/phosphatidylglycerophosphate/cardiolipin synthase-like enzyme
MSTPRDIDLVWTGPELPGTTARDTLVVVRELFATAKKRVLVVGYTFDHGAEIMRPLYEAMRDHGVETDIYLDLPPPKTGVTSENHVRRFVNEFLASNWPFGAPVPRIFYDPRTITRGSRASLHAKCIVVDDRRVLVTSANFTSRGQERNIEVGVLIDDEALARRLAGQFQSALLHGFFVEA